MILNYCTECAAPLNKKNDTEYICENDHSFWNNPHTCTAVVLIKDGKILVSKRGREPFKGKYDLPGGFLEFGEDPLLGAQREVLEETTIQIDKTDLQIIAGYSGPYFENESVCDIIVLAKNWTGTPLAQDDSAALEWQPLDFLDSEQFDPDYVGLSEILKDRLQ